MDDEVAKSEKEKKRMSSEPFDAQKFADCKQCQWLDQKTADLERKVSHCNACYKIYNDPAYEDYRKIVAQKFHLSKEDLKRLTRGTGQGAYQLFLSKNKTLDEKVMGLAKLIQDILLALKQSRKDISLLRNNIITDLEHMKMAPDKTQQMRLVNTQREELAKKLYSYDRKLEIYKQTANELFNLSQECENWAVKKKYDPLISICNERLANVSQNMAKEIDLSSGWQFSLLLSYLVSTRLIMKL
jgi:hypothetical protein